MRRKKILKLLSLAMCLMAIGALLQFADAATTVVDLTEFANGSTTTHSHQWVAAYNESEHWQYCAMCGETQDVHAHSLSTRFTIGVDSCSPYNYKITTCSGCAYSVKVKSQASHTLGWYQYGINTPSVYTHPVYARYGVCSVCGEFYGHVYGRDAGGNLIDPSKPTAAVTAYFPDGGTHTYNWSMAVQKVMRSAFDYTYEVTARGTIRFTVVFTIPKEYRGLLSDEEILMLKYCVLTLNIFNAEGDGLRTDRSVSATSVSGSKITFVVDFNYIGASGDLSALPAVVAGVRFRLYNEDESFYRRALWSTGTISLPDLRSTPPVISSAAVTTGSTLNGYADSASVTVRGSIVGSHQGYVTVTDAVTGSVLYPRTFFNVNGDDTYALELSLGGVQHEGGSAIVKVEDSFHNYVTEEIILPSIDTQAPIITNLTDIDLTGGWEKAKTLTLELSDVGVGGVQVAVNSESNYLAATDLGGGAYTITYTLTGNVYTPKNLCIFVKDALGNYASTLIPVDKLDNAPPIVESLSFYEEVGQPPGLMVVVADSGCGHDRLFVNTPSSTTLQLDDLNSCISVTPLREAGWYTVYAQDQLGNRSEESRVYAALRGYTVTFEDWDGAVISSATYHWGDSIPVPADPVRDSDGTYAYTFVDWGGAISTTCTGDATYTAQYTPTYIDYTVTFEDWDGSVISSDTYHWGDTITVPADPTKASDDTYTYDFSVWSPDVSTTCAGNATYTAQYTPTYIDYTVTFEDWDGSVISSQTYHWGDSIAVPSSPTRPATAETVYTFSVWSPDVSATCAGDTTYTAVYAENAAEHSVTFVDWDGAVLSSDVYPYGAPIVVPADPYRVSDDTYVYTFRDWSPVVSATCIGGAYYVAQYTPTYIDYTVTFEDWDGTDLSSETYHWGDTVTVPADPYRVADDTYIYTFSDWSPDVSVTCAGDATYVAQYTPAYVDYTVAFEDWDGTPLYIRTDYHWGDAVTVPADPTRAANNEYTYTFSAWSPDVSPIVNGDATYTAQYTSTYINYTVTFEDWDGTVLSSETYHWGDAVTVPADPTRDADNRYTYTFSVWSPDVSATCTGDATYTAQYTAEPIPVQGGGGSGGFGSSLGGGSIQTTPSVEPEEEFEATTVESLISAVHDCCGDGSCLLHTYTDVGAKEWYHDGVHFCLQSGLMQGTTETQFEPDTDATRATVVKSLWLLEDKAEPVGTEGTSYEDVSSDMDAFDAIRWATATGIVNGYGDGSFGPDDSITREQLATVLWRYITHKGCTLEEDETVDIFSFDDALEISDWALTGMRGICSVGLIQGTPEGELAPLSSTTRAQLATILLRFCEEIADTYVKEGGDASD